MNFLRTLCPCILILVALGAWSDDKSFGKGVIIAKLLVRGEERFVVGQMVNRPRTVEDFLQDNFISTNLVGVSQWVAKTNLNVDIVREARPETFTPPATNVVRMSDEEWYTIFPYLRPPSATNSAPKASTPKP